MRQRTTLLVLSYFFVTSLFSYALIARAEDTTSLQSQIDANNAQLAALQSKIAEYQKQLDAIGVEKNTLQSAIASLTLTQQQLSAQIQVTQNKIASANLQIQKLSQSIGDKEENVGENQAAIGKALRSTAQDEDISLVTQIISANSLADAWQRADQAVQFNVALSGNIASLRSLQATLAQNRSEVSDSKATLLALQTDLSNQKQAVLTSKAQEQQLLKDTKNQEANYQKLLASAKAELNSYSAFTTNAGGSKLLGNQTVCDDWGCYYSQRDTAWGNIPLNKTKYSLASDGCLVTAMAMVMTHYGYKDVTPVTVNANPNNFASYFPAYLLSTIVVDGVSATRKATTIDATLAGGDPVVVGLHAYGGTHYVVLVSGSRGNYLMRDPYVANGKDINFTSHYSVKAIFGITKVLINS